MKPTVNESLLSALVSEGGYGSFGGGSESVKFRHEKSRTNPPAPRLEQLYSVVQCLWTAIG